jgi:hypothetical protein
VSRRARRPVGKLGRPPLGFAPYGTGARGASQRRFLARDAPFVHRLASFGRPSRGRVSPAVAGKTNRRVQLREQAGEASRPRSPRASLAGRSKPSRQRSPLEMTAPESRSGSRQRNVGGVGRATGAAAAPPESSVFGKPISNQKYTNGQSLLACDMWAIYTKITLYCNYSTD